MLIILECISFHT